MDGYIHCLITLLHTFKTGTSQRRIYQKRQKKAAVQSHVVSQSLDDSTSTANIIEDQNQDKDVEAPLTTSIKKNRNVLLGIIDIQCGLLDEMASLNILSHEDLDAITCQRAIYGKINKLLDDVVAMSSDQQEQFLLALEQTNQGHVSQYIKLDGIPPENDADDWPVRACEEEMRLIEVNRPKFIELVDSRNGLLDEMLSAGCISYAQRQHIESGSSARGK